MVMLGGKVQKGTILGMKGKPHGCLNRSVSQALPDGPMDPPHWCSHSAGFGGS